MNATAVMREDFIRASRLSFQQTSIGGIPTSKWPNLNPSIRRKPRASDFTPVDYEKYFAKMQDMKLEEGPSYDNTIDPSDIVMPMSEKIGKMFGEFPFRDPAYLVAMLFLFGSVVFTANSVFLLIPLIAPQLAFPGIMTIAFPVTIFIGATSFLTAGLIDIFGAFNAQNGVMEIAKDKNGVKYLEHQPALLGSEEWCWGACGRFRYLILNDAAFQSGLFQLFGGVVLSVAAWTTIPGLVDPEASYFPLLAFVPQVVGGAVIFMANAILMFGQQDRWWKPKILDAKWEGAFWAGLGGLGFMLAGVFLLLGDFLASAWVSLIGSVAFLLGSILAWYDIMGVV